MVQVLLHPGFHKTGTSSLQQGAADLRSDLAGHLRLRFTDDVHEATRMAKRFSAYRAQHDLERFAFALSTALAPMDTKDRRAVLITSEDLCGYIPGNHGVESYSAAIPLMNVATAVIQAQFGVGAQITVFFTTRRALSWQRSVWWQNLRAMRLTEDFSSYRASLSAAARHDRIVTAVRDRVGARAKVVGMPIEECGTDPLGPLGAALNLLEIPTNGLPNLPARNVQPDEAAEELLELNRSDLSDDALSKAKRRVLQRHRAAGATTSGA